MGLLSKVLTQEDFLFRAKEKHGNRYNYDKSVYKTFHEKICIKCEYHGDFYQKPSHHLSGHGCRKCASAELSKKFSSWNDLDVKFLKENYIKIGRKECVKRLNRKKSCVASKARALGLTNKFVSKNFHPHIPSGLWGNLIRGARDRGIIVAITQEDIWQKYVSQGKSCALTGWPIDLDKSNNEITASVDRIDSNKDYTLDNIQIVHKTVNRSKSDIKEEFFYKICKSVSENKAEDLDWPRFQEIWTGDWYEKAEVYRHRDISKEELF
jgi:hypothetical protein